MRIATTLIVLSSKLPKTFSGYEHWLRPNPTITDEAPDRVVHRAHPNQFKAEPMRKLQINKRLHGFEHGDKTH